MISQYDECLTIMLKSFYVCVCLTILLPHFVCMLHVRGCVCVCLYVGFAVNIISMKLVCVHMELIVTHPRLHARFYPSVVYVCVCYSYYVTHVCMPKFFVCLSVVNSNHFPPLPSSFHIFWTLLHTHTYTHSVIFSFLH